MAQRPRLDMKGWYFTDSYEFEINCLQTQENLMRDISDYLIKNEKKQNKDIKDYLQMTYRITQDFTNKDWTDVRPEDIGKEVKAR